jgi:uncharacterized protein
MPLPLGKLLVIFLLIITSVFFINIFKARVNSSQNSNLEELSESVKNIYPLSIEYMRSQDYPGSDIVIEETLAVGFNYSRYIVSYISDGFKINALLTVPNAEKPENGWPVIIFNHGYIQPEQYRTTEKYVAYTDAFSRNGYIVLKSDYRGHGSSEGNPEGAYYSPAYTIDILNAVSSIKKFEEADPNKIGMWGHSMGGMITLRSMVVKEDIKVAEIWAGVAVSYEDIATNWHHPVHNPRPWVPSQREQAIKRPRRQDMTDRYGSFEEAPQFWQSISPIFFISDINAPIQLQHGTADNEVPLLFSQILEQELKKADKQVELFTYEGDNHNLSNNLSLALKRSVEFFDKHLK